MGDVEQLEREVRELRDDMVRERRRSRFAVLGALVLVLAGASTPPTALLRAERIEVGEGDPGIVLVEGPDGPSITLSNGNRTTRLTLAGLELTTKGGEPSDRPTLGDPGLGESTSMVTDVPPLVVEVGRDVYVSHLEVTCSNGFRNRSLFHEGRAVMQVPTDNGDCKALFGGGFTGVRLQVEAGDELRCQPFAKNTALNCTKVGSRP